MSMNVAFVVPFAMRTTMRFVRCVAALPGVRLGLVTMDPLERVSPELREQLAGHWRVETVFDAGQLTEAVTGLATQMGSVDRLLTTLEELQVPVAEVRDTLGIPGMGPDAARNFRDKSRMKDVLRAAGVPCARHARATSVEEGMAFSRTCGFPLVVKPPEGAGARSTFRVDDPEQLAQALTVHRPSPERPVQIEEFVIGDEHSFETISIGGRPVWHAISRYLNPPLEVLRNPWIQWCVLVPREIDHPRYDDIRSTAVSALSALGMGTGVSHMEWFRRRDGTLAVSEIAMRPPGANICTMHSFAHDFDFYSAWARVVVFGRFQAPDRRYACGTAFLRGQGQGRVRAVHGLDAARKGLERLGVTVVEVNLPAVGQRQASGYEGEGYVILRHPETAAVEKGLAHLVTQIRVEME